MLRLIGDIHGRSDLYNKATRGCQASLQVGDFGMGFIRDEVLRHAFNPPGTHLFIRGNHDDPAASEQMPNFIQSGSHGEAFVVNGGWSIDKWNRIEGIDWWPEEEHSIRDLGELVDVYRAAKPRFVISHEAPWSVIEHLLGNRTFPPGPSRTSQCLNEMFEFHKPELWVFGHWHKSLDYVVKGTQFVCLAEGETRDFLNLDVKMFSANDND